MLTTCALLFALSAGAMRADDDGTAVPAGIAPTAMTLSKLLTHVRNAAGHPPNTRVEHWTIHRYGSDGVRDLVELGKAYRVDETMDGIHTAYGDDGTAWHQTENGDVVTDSGIHHRSEADALALLHPTPATVSLLGAVEKPVPAYVVRVFPPDGRLEYVFYDEKTYLMDRVEESRAGTRYVETYGDFRATGGVLRPWHVEGISARTGSQDSADLLNVTYDKTIESSSIARPVASSVVTLTQSPALLPAKIISDRIIVTLKISGHPVNLQLDSGASSILIDEAVVEALKIPIVEKHTETMAGNYHAGKARIPAIAIGDAALHNVVVNVVPFAWNDDTTVVAGLLGFDFINSIVLHIDYAKGVVEALDPTSFAAPANATMIPISLDDDVPVLAAGIARAVGNHFILDTGADRSALYSGFVDAHAHAVVDQGLGTQMREEWPFETAFNGVGGKVSYHPVQAGPFTFGGQTFPQWLFQATYGAASFEDEDYDGLIGQDVLRYFDVYLDYPHRRIYVLPNERFRNRWD